MPDCSPLEHLPHYFLVWEHWDGGIDNPGSSKRSHHTHRLLYPGHRQQTCGFDLDTKVGD